MTTNIHYLIAGMAVLLVVLWQYSRQRQMDDRNSLMFRRLLSVVSLDVAAELVSTGFILYAPYSFNVCRMLSNTVFYLFQALLPLLLLYYVCTLCTSRVIAPSVVLRMGIPTIALVFVILTNPFTEILFYFDSTGYRHGRGICCCMSAPCCTSQGRRSLSRYTARRSAAARSRSCSRSLRSPPSASPRRPSILRC